MKNYKNYINENNFLEFLKKGFKNTITMLQKPQQDKITSLIQKINTSETFQFTITTLTTFFRSNMNPNFESIDEMKKYLNDDLISVDMALKTTSKKYGADMILPKNFFSESNNNLLKKVFVQDDEKDFLKNLQLSVNSITEQILKNMGMSEDEINNFNKEEKTHINESDEIQHLQNTDKLDTLKEEETDEKAKNTEEDKEKEDNTKEDKEKKQQLQQIKNSYNDFQRNSLYEPLIKKLEVFNKERQNQDPTKF